MSYGPDGGYSNVMTAAIDNRLPFIQKVYGVFLLGILVSVGSAAVICSSQALVLATLQSYLLVILAFFGLFFIASAVRRTPGVNLVMMLAFCAASGVMIAPRLYIAARFTPGTLPMAGALTTLAFVALTGYAMLSGKNFSYLGAGLTVALLGLIVGGFLNAIFFQSPFTHYLMAWAAVVIFSGYVLYDTSVIVRDLPDEEYIAGALSLYLDFVNLFLAILRILGGGRR